MFLLSLIKETLVINNVSGPKLWSETEQRVNFQLCVVTLGLKCVSDPYQSLLWAKPKILGRFLET